jgi:DNA polymerase III subunit chi
MDIKFYHNAPDRLRAACVVTAKAVQQGLKVIVYAPDGGLARQYDSLLWRAQPQSFVPHVAASSPLAAQTPVVMVHELTNLPYDDMLLNLADDLPTGYDHFRLLVEIVGNDEAGRSAARSRWRFYKEHAHTVQAYDLAKARS